MNDFKPGEIWESVSKDWRKPVEYFLIIVVQEKYCNVLKLQTIDAEKAKAYGRIKVLARREMYTDVGMLSYVLNDRLTGFIRTLPEEEFEAIRTQVIEKLGFERGFSAAEVGNLVSKRSIAEKRVAELEVENEKIKIENERLQAKATELDKNAMIAYDSMSDLEGKLEASQKERDGLMHEVDRLNAELMLKTGSDTETIKMQVERDFYKEQYEKLFQMVTDHENAM